MNCLSRPSTIYRFIVFAVGVFTTILLCCCVGCSRTKPIASQQSLQGSTMGTTYTIRYRPEADSEWPIELQRLIDDELGMVNHQMSTYLTNSEVTVFNDSQSMEWISVSPETAQVIALALQISDASDGAFDITVGPLVNLWGFGPGKRSENVPMQAAIEAARALVGYKHLAVRLDPPAIKKAIPGLQIDLSAIAKGHGVDRVGKLLSNQGLTNYFVEIGGEIVAKGFRADGQAWQVGIEAPQDSDRSIQTILGLSDAAIATSGDYRNFFEHQGQRFSHTIDPSTGRPVTHQLASASVIADHCALADAIATSMMALGPERGLELAEKNDWAVLLIRRDDDRLISEYSTRFAKQFPEVCKRISVTK